MKEITKLFIEISIVVMVCLGCVIILTLKEEQVQITRTPYEVIVGGYMDYSRPTQNYTKTLIEET